MMANSNRVRISDIFFSYGSLRSFFVFSSGCQTTVQEAEGRRQAAGQSGSGGADDSGERFGDSSDSVTDPETK